MAGAINYLGPSVRPSLYRTGELLTRRDPDGSDAGTQGIVLEERKLEIRDARALNGPERRSVARNGFELIARPLARPALDFFDHREVVRDYYGECADTVREATGAHRVFAFDHNVRSAAEKESERRIAGGQQVQAPPTWRSTLKCVSLELLVPDARCPLAHLRSSPVPRAVVG